MPVKKDTFFKHGGLLLSQPQLPGVNKSSLIVDQECN